METEFQELIDSYINGNRSYVMEAIHKFRKKKLIAFFFYLNQNENWLGKKTCDDLIYAIYRRSVL